MDDIDRKIIDLLQIDGRTPQSRLADAVGLSVSAVSDRIKRLEHQGVIAGWSVRLDPGAFALDLLAFVHIRLERPEHDAGFAAAMRGLPEVQECHHITGAWSYLLKVRVATTADLERLLVDAIKCLPGVVQSETVVVLSSIKETPDLPIRP